MKIVFLDHGVVNPGDLSWEPIEKLGQFEHYKQTSAEELDERLHGTEAVLIDSFQFDRERMGRCPTLKFIGIAATGFNHVDLEAAKELGIAVANVPAYSTDAVAQQAVSLLLSVTNRVDRYNRSVVAGTWRDGARPAFVDNPITLLAGKTMGIIGYGNIGRKVAEIARAFGMEVHIYSRDPEAAIKADVISLHCPLTPETEKMIDESFISRMKDGAILINTARGGLVDEEALAAALKSGKLSGAGLDVLAQEPPQQGSPLIGLENCYITPHIGFSPAETRRVVIDTCAANLESFLRGGTLNRLV